MQGISVYTRKGRPTWSVSYTNPETGKRVFRSSGYQVSDPTGKASAYAWAREVSQSGIGVGLGRDHERWEVWADRFLRSQFRKSNKTLTSYLGAWKHLAIFLRDRKIHSPRLLKYQHVVEFVHWRESQIKRSGKKVKRNTALHNTRILSRLMREAVRRDFAAGNPCANIGDDVPADPTPEKPEYTDEDIAKVRAELARRSKIGRPSDWMPIAFEIALAQGCRISATQIPMHRIDFVRWTMRLTEKGAAEFTVPVNPILRPLLLRLKDEGRAFTCVVPRFASRNFSRVLKSAGLKAPPGMSNHTFHSTRVTLVSRGARAGISEQKMMAMVHHGNWLVHKQYTRLQPADVADAYPALGIPAAPEPEPSERRTSDDS